MKLYNNYIQSNFFNYQFIKKKYNVPDNNFIQYITLLFDSFKKFRIDIKTHIDDFDFLINKWSNNKHISILFKISNISKNNSIDFIKLYHDYYKSNNSFPSIKYKLLKFNKSIDNPYYLQKFNSKLVSQYKNFNSSNLYDKKIFQFEYILDDFYYHLNSFPISLGKSIINYDTLEISLSNFDSNIKTYYYNYFNYNGPLSLDSKAFYNILYSYFEGLIWVFNVYFNQNSFKYEHSNSNFWYYKFNYSPLLLNLFDLLSLNMKDPNFINTILFGLKNYVIPRPSFFNCLEQLLYVTPAPLIINLIPKEYHKFINSNVFYPNIKKIFLNIIEKFESSPSLSPSSSPPFNILCSGMLYLNSCIIFNLDYNCSDSDFINKIRSIKLSNSSLKLIGCSYYTKIIDYKSICVFIHSY
jgi:hypothetical protein